MAAAGGAQQCGAALRVGGVNRKSQLQQAMQGGQVACNGGGRQVAGPQPSARQFPAAPFQPFGKIPASAGQGNPQGRQTVGRPPVGRGPGCDQHPRFGQAAFVGGVVQGAQAARVAGGRVCTEVEQLLQKPAPAQAGGEQHGWLAGRTVAEWIRPASQQFQCAGFGAVVG